jgi:hypothetical protein
MDEAPPPPAPPELSPRQERLLRLMHWLVWPAFGGAIAIPILDVRGAPRVWLYVAMAGEGLAFIAVAIVGTLLGRSGPPFERPTVRIRREWRELKEERGGTWPALRAFVARRLRPWYDREVRGFGKKLWHKLAIAFLVGTVILVVLALLSEGGS